MVELLKRQGEKGAPWENREDRTSKGRAGELQNQKPKKKTRTNEETQVLSTVLKSNREGQYCGACLELEWSKGGRVGLWGFFLGLVVLGAFEFFVMEQGRRWERRANALRFLSGESGKKNQSRTRAEPREKQTPNGVQVSRRKRPTKGGDDGNQDAESGNKKNGHARLRRRERRSSIYSRKLGVSHSGKIRGWREKLSWLSLEAIESSRRRSYPRKTLESAVRRGGSIHRLKHASKVCRETTKLGRIRKKSQNSARKKKRGGEGGATRFGGRVVGVRGDASSRTTPHLTLLLRRRLNAYVYGPPRNRARNTGRGGTSVEKGRDQV